MSEMFQFANYFNQPLNNWNVMNVKDMTEMFCGTISFNRMNN